MRKVIPGSENSIKLPERERDMTGMGGWLSDFPNGGNQSLAGTQNLEGKRVIFIMNDQKILTWFKRELETPMGI